MRKILPYLATEYFDNNEKVVFDYTKEFVSKYNNSPSKEALILSIDESKKFNETKFKEVVSLLDSLYQINEKQDEKWLVDLTNQFISDKAIENALVNSIKILNEEKAGGTISRGVIPELLSKALAVGLDESIGHEYVSGAGERYDFYHRKVRKIPFDLQCFNQITDGGFEPKTLNVILAQTGCGKTLIKCHMAANCLMKNYNVLYITLEMQEKMIAKRIDANLFGLALDDLNKLDRDTYERKVRISTTKIKGKLYVKEYAPTLASVSHFKHLLNELKLKKKFIPDIIFVDYLNLCASSRVKLSNSVNSYTLVKSVAEELRSLAVEYDLPVVSSTQTNRQGMGNSDVDMTNVSESIGLPATCDLMIAAIRNEQLDSMNQMLFKQLKNRYSDLAKFNKFVLGVDRSKMKLFDLSESAQTMLNSGIDTGSISNQKITNKSFGGFKV